MQLVNSKDKDKQTRHERARAAIEAHTTKFETLNSAAPLRKGQHLDVDGILERSLPKTVSQWS